MSERVLRVSSVRTATASSRIVRLHLGGAAFPFRPGQSVTLGPPEQPARVPYSLASAPEDVVRDDSLEFLIKVDAAGRWGEDFEPLRRGTRPLARNSAQSLKRVAALIDPGQPG